MAFRAAEYARFTGQRSRLPAWWPIFTSTLRRGWSSVWVKRITRLSFLMGLALVIFFYALNQVIPEWRDLAERMGRNARPDGGDFVIDASIYLRFLYFFVYPVLLPLSLVFGSDLIASDLRTNALESYFSRPVTPVSYLLGRTLAFTAFLLIATLGPMLLTWVGDWATADEGHFERIRGVPAGMSAALGLVAITCALVVQAVTSLTRNATWTNLVLVVLFIFSIPAAHVLHEITGQSAFLGISLFQDIAVVCAVCLGQGEDLGRDQPTPATAFGVLLGIAGLSLLILMRTLRRKSLVG